MTFEQELNDAMLENHLAYHHGFINTITYYLVLSEIVALRKNNA